MKQQLKDLINSTMDECYDYSHYQEAILSEDETQCYRTGYIDGLKQALLMVDENTNGYTIEMEDIFDNE